jgi:hypothetical protein
VCLISFRGRTDGLVEGSIDALEYAYRFTHFWYVANFCSPVSCGHSRLLYSPYDTLYTMFHLLVVAEIKWIHAFIKNLMIRTDDQSMPPSVWADTVLGTERDKLQPSYSCTGIVFTFILYGKREETSSLGNGCDIRLCLCSGGSRRLLILRRNLSVLSHYKSEKV